MLEVSKKTIKLPSFGPELAPAREVDYAELLASFKRQVNTIPEFVGALKEADNAGWQQLVDDMTEHIKSDPKLSKFMRVRQEKGVSGLSIGEPNIFIHLVAAFAVGYALGTLCYETGPCKFV